MVATRIGLGELDELEVSLARGQGPGSSAILVVRLWRAGAAVSKRGDCFIQLPVLCEQQQQQQHLLGECSLANKLSELVDSVCCGEGKHVVAEQSCEWPRVAWGGLGWCEREDAQGTDPMVVACVGSPALA